VTGFLERALVPTTKRHEPLPVGLHHYVRAIDGAPARYHLRVEPDGGAILIANASSMLSLSAHGAVAAKAILDGTSDELTADELARRFRAPNDAETLAAVRRLAETIDRMAHPSGGVVASQFGDVGSLRERALSAPLAADVVAPELGHGPDIVRRLWDAGIPQVRFVLPAEQTGRHLVRLVELAEDLGMIAGVRSRASDLAASSLVRDLAMAGLDHLDVYWTGPNRSVHDALFGEKDHRLALETFEECRALEVCPVAVLPLLDDIIDALDALGEALVAHRIPALVAYAICSREGQGRIVEAPLLAQAATTLEEIAEHANKNLVWAPPQERDERVTLAEQVRAGPRTTGEACIRVEPDGRVLAPEGRPDAAGNLLTDPWPAIWAHGAFAHWRTSVAAAERCDRCPGLALCRAGCPSSRSTWALATGGAS
jgi:radical SAM protein with 4Fe4S-binding SPASM domain